MTLIESAVHALNVQPGNGRPPRAPAGLGKPGNAFWRATCAATWLLETDYPTLAGLARLVDLRAALEEEIKARGVVVEEPVITPRGDIAGTRLLAHPCVSELCRVDRRLADGMATLGLTSRARAALGLLVGEGERLQLSISDFLQKKYERGAQ